MTILPPSPPRTEKPTGTTGTFPAPTGAQIIRALRAPAIAYAWLLLGAVVMVVLILVAANVGSTSDTTGVDSDDTNGLGVLLGMPFQIAGMALLGSLQFSEDGVRASLFLPPLALTALYVAMTARGARRGEMIPAAGTRALLSVIVGCIVAVVVTPLTWALAMREDGVALHAASVSLFFGVWVLTGAASFVGTSRAADATRPAWIPSDYVVAARVWVGSVAVWVAVAVAVLAVVAVVDEGLWVAILFPLWGVTIGLYSYAIGHLGGVSLGGEGINIGDFSAGWTILAVVGAVALALLTSIAWHLRRDAREASLAQPGSWVVMPAVYAVGGLVVWLVPSVVLGGGYGELGASVTLQPAFWLIFVLAVWGATVELASRFVAPAVAPTLPPRVREILRGPDSAEAPPMGVTTDAPNQAPRPLTPEERARYKRIGIVVGVLVALGIIGWITVSVVNSQLYRPEDQASAYLDAVVDGNLDRVTELAPVDDQADDSLLTGDVYRAAENRITGYEIEDVDKTGDTATVKVRLEGLDHPTSAELTLKKDGHSGVLFDKWSVTGGGLATAVGVSTPDGAGDLTVNGVAVDQPASDVWLLPGDYVFDAYAGNKWLESDGDPITVTADEYQFAEVPGAVASDAFKDEVQRQVDEYLQTCMASTELEPDGCPNTTYAGSDVRNVVWTMDQAPTPDFEYFDGTFPADLSYGDSGHATVTYEADESYGFGKPDWQQETDESDLYLDSITVTEEGDDLEVTIGD